MARPHLREPSNNIMVILPSESRQIARLINALMYGEYIAQDCAWRQARLRSAVAPRTAKFLRRQARQEQFHRQVFKSALLWLDHRELEATPKIEPLQQLHSMLIDAIANDRYAESIFGLQLVLEGMGDAVLTRLNSGLNVRKVGLKKLRHIILYQEKAHHSFGLNEYRRTQSSNQPQSSYEKAYTDLSWQTFCHLSPVFESLNQDIQAFQNDVLAHIPGHSMVSQ